MPGYKKSQVLYRDLAPFHPFLCRLDDVGSLRATRTFDNLELDILTLIERLEPVSYTHLTLPTICSV